MSFPAPELAPATRPTPPASPVPVPSAHGEGSGTARLPWADVAKGACILLVVLHHTLNRHAWLLLPPESAAGVAWQVVNEALRPLRMPLFFLLSGVFAASALRRPWSQVWVRRLLTTYWVYTVWLAVQAGVFLTVATRMATTRVPDAGAYLEELLLASSGLWYLYGLVVYFAVAKVLVKVPAPLVVAAAAVLSGAASYLPIEAFNQVQLLQCFVFFAAGAHYPRLLAAMPALPRWALAAVAAGYLGAHQVLTEVVETEHSVAVLLLAPVAIPLGAQLAQRLHRPNVVGRALAALGRRTLPVYVLHMPLLALAHQALTRPDGTARATLPDPVAALAAGYPLLAAVAVTAACLAVHRLLLLGRAGFLFTLPGPRRPESGRTVVAPAQRPSRCRSPLARSARRSTAERTDSSVPTTRTFCSARVTAV